ncbi:kinase [Thalassotalea euphylliae]|uniref:Kinase n=1 Tax=Thalassotalea euphylliae TaxID=1655234 RepID=A0A3E0UD89_9GAMM|nr:kinase [Thalassotalea euphylliae]REL34839.1 kinase [Thalassotalea euphylliae]
MIITRTPFRVSFFGGGSDFPAFYDEHGGAVLSTSIDKFCYITVRELPPFFDHKYRIRYTKREETNSILDINHPSVRACLQHMEVQEGLEVLHTSDIPAMSGIGSSSSFTVGLLNALHAYRDEKVSKSELCQGALHVEQAMLEENVGSQDQTAASYGGFNKITFKKNMQPLVSPVAIQRHRRVALENHLMLFFTRFSRVSDTIAKTQIEKTPALTSELSSMRAMVEQAIEILVNESNSLDQFGELMHDSWQIKRTLTEKITNPEIDGYYEKARAAGAIGGKLCGAGGGGFFMLFVPPEKQETVKKALHNLLHVPFNFDFGGTQVIYNSKY